MKKEFTNADGLTVTAYFQEELQPEPSAFQSIAGGLQQTPATWEEYRDLFEDSYAPYFDLIKTAIEQLEWVGKCADEMANDTVFQFSDGGLLAFTWRAWGDLMSAIVGKGEGYMKYYMN